MILDKDLAEFKRLYQAEYGVLLEDPDAIEKASNVLGLVRLIVSQENININQINSHGKEVQPQKNSK